RDRYHADGIRIGAKNPIESINPAGSSRYIDGRQAVGQAVITFRRHGAGLFMMAGHILESVAAANSIIEMHGSASSYQKHVTDAVSGQGLSYEICDANHEEKIDF